MAALAHKRQAFGVSPKVVRECAYCAADVTLWPPEALASPLSYFPASGALQSREYCSEYCMIQDYLLAMGAVHRDACIARVARINKAFNYHDMRYVGIAHGSRRGQRLPFVTCAAPLTEGERRGKAARAADDMEA